MKPPSDEPAIRSAVQVTVRGVVQGVGFRPFVYRLAHEHGVTGWVRNDPIGVVMHLEAAPARLETFLAALRSEAPPAAVIAQVSTTPAEVGGASAFAILTSRTGAPPLARISPDLATCAACLRELRDPADPRYGYPYINCTHCGPRYSIIAALPYDRPNTSMSTWPLCPACAREYADPGNRRFHAQPVACPACGPEYHLEQDGRCVARGPAAPAAAAALLRSGGVVAVKGLGGYHLACAADDAAVVHKLRLRKYRKEKPFAVMMRDLEEARAWLRLTPAHESLLTSPARPIVLAPARRALPGVAPDNPRLGVMLPYTPLHALLFDAGAPSPLVLTSANRASEPIAYRDDEARSLLAGLADAFLIGARRIVRRVDDSVVEVHAGRPLLVRRARGYAPDAVAPLPAGGPLLALGADLKNTITLVVDGVALLSPHIGDLADAETEQSLRATVADWLSMYRIAPETLTVACDLHPQYRSTRIAQELPAARRVAVQHHAAHVAAVAAEYECLEAPLLGVVLDGTGYGLDGTIWGGEFLAGSVRGGFTRCGALRPVRLPGGDAAARWPVQAAAGFLEGLEDLADFHAPPFAFPARFSAALKLLAGGVRCFETTSAGRLFDTVAALLGFIGECTFEGQAAIWLEHQASQAAEADDAYPFDGEDTRTLLSRVIADRLWGRPICEIAACFHRGLALGLAERACRLAAERGIRRVVLSGGVFQNTLLRTVLHEALAAQAGVEVLLPTRAPVNDGGISLGQAALACFAAR